MPILLVQPWNVNYKKQPPAESLGLGYIASVLRDHGLEVEIIDGLISKLTPEQLACEIVRRDPTLVGISVHGQILAESTWHIVQMIRSKGGQAHICLGGYFPSAEHRRLLEKWKEIDSVVRGEGEYTFLQLAQRVLSGRLLTDVDGVTYRSEGRIIVNHRRQRISRLDVLPLVARDTLSAVLQEGGSAQVVAGRGCVHSRCSFCSTAAFYNNAGFRHVRSPQNVVEEIASIVNRYGCNFFRFSDDNFIEQSANSLQWVNTFRQEIGERKFRISFRINARADCINREIMANLKRVGLWEVSVGLETMSEDTMDLYSKGTTINDNINALNILESLDIRYKPSFILFNPYVTWSALKSTIRYVTRIQTRSLKSFSRSLIPYAGTPIRANMIQEGLLDENVFWNMNYEKFQDTRVAQLHSLLNQIHNDFSALNFYMSEFRDRWIWQLSEFSRILNTNLPVSWQFLLRDMRHYNQEVEFWAGKFVLKLIDLIEAERVDYFDKLVQDSNFEFAVKKFREKAQDLRDRGLSLCPLPCQNTS